MALLKTRVLIGLEAMGYQPLYHTREKAAIKSTSGCCCKMKSGRFSSRFWLSNNSTHTCWIWNDYCQLSATRFI